MSRLLITFLVGLPVFCSAASINSIPAEHKRRVRDAILKSMADAQMTDKEVYLPAGWDAPRWSRFLAGDEDFGIYRIALLPLRFQTAFLSNYAFTVIQDRASELAEDFRRRA